MTCLRSIATSFFAVRRRLGSERGVSLIVVLMLMVIILAMAGAGMLFSSMDLRAAGNFRAGTQAFFAADTGVNDAFTRITGDPAASTAPFGPITLVTPSGNLQYCSGKVGTTGTNCSTPQPLQAPQLVNVAGYNLSQSGVQFYQYQVNVTGIQPQLSSAREVEAQVQYGPVPK
jgi:Tfp pilus assembly protein PilX